jgi:hypothetical protein
MATCRKVLVRRTIEAIIRIERSIAYPGSCWATVLGPVAPEDVSHFEPEGTGPDVTGPEKTQETMTEIRLELSEAEAKDLMELFQQNTLVCRSIGEALIAVLDEGKDFATRRPKNAGTPWKPWPDVAGVMDEAIGNQVKLRNHYGQAAAKIDFQDADG